MPPSSAGRAHELWLAALFGCAGGVLATVAALKHYWPSPSIIGASAANDAKLAAVPDTQLDPAKYEDAGSDDRLARRIETVLQRRTSRIAVVLERLCDGHNYAAVFRTCEAAGIQNVFLISPPAGQVRYESATMQKRRLALELAAKDAAKESNRRGCDPAPAATSRRQMKRNKRGQAAANVWETDVALDTQHASYGKNATRFLTVREFATSEEAMTALRASGHTVWATDLGQGAVVLAPGAAWLGDTPRSLPSKLAIVIGTESTGVSEYILANCDRRVYLPQNGFADSLNASVAAALSIHTLLMLYGPLACGDFVHDASEAQLAEIRTEWASHLSRDDEQMQRMLSLLTTGEVEVYDDLRRPDKFRQHCGRETKFERRRSHKQREAERLAAAAAKA